MNALPLDFSIFETDTITVNIKRYDKTFQVVIGTLTWEEWFEPETIIPDAKIRYTKIVPKDDGTFDKLPNLEDIDYKNEKLAVISKRNALRVIKALEKGGAKFEGTRDEKIKQVTNNVAVFAAIWKAVNDSANAFSAQVEATADSFRASTNGSTHHEDVPDVGDNAVEVREPSLN